MNSILYPFVLVFSLVRSFFMLLYIPFCTLVIASTIIVSALFGAGKKWMDFLICTLWAKSILFFSGVELDVRGLERLPDTGGLFLFNHTSNYDIFAMFAAMKDRSLMFGAKAELFKVPFLGRAMSVIGALPIERKNPERVFQIYKMAEERMRNGESFALAPEGGRVLDDELGEFKSGPFIFALGAQGPLFPVVITGARKINPSGSIHANVGRMKRKIIVEALNPVPTQGLQQDDVKDLKQTVREQMLIAYEANKKEMGITKNPDN